MRDSHPLAAFSVLVHSGGCEVVGSAIRALASNFESELRPFATVSVNENQGDWDDPVAEFLSNGSATSSRLIDYLAREMGQLRTINLVSLVATETDGPKLEEIDRFVARLKDVIGDMGQVTCRDYRFAFPAYGALVPREPFFSQKADANVISVPRDSASHEAIARPVSADQQDSYAGHVAVELATSVGLWREMEDSLLDEIPRINPGTNDVIVRYISGRANYLVCPPLPIDRLMSEDGELPLPHGFHPAPDPQQAVERLARLIYPEELRYSPSSPPSGPEYTESGKKLRWRYLREFLSATAHVPRALLRGVQDHLEGLSGAALQEALGSSESSIEVLYPGRYVDEESVATAIAPDAIQKVINEVGERVDRPVLTTIGEGLWIDIVDKVIAVVDGGTAGVDVRTSFADERYLLVDQSALAPMSESVVEILQEIHVEPRRDLQSDGGGDDSGESDAVNLLSEKTEDNDPIYPHHDDVSERVSDHSEVLEENVTATVGESEVFADSGVLNSFGGSTSQAEVPDVDESEALLQDDSEQEAHTARTLVREIAHLLASEQEAARTHAERMVKLLLELPSRFRPRDSRTVSTAVRISVALGLSLVYFTFGALTERRHLVNFEGIGRSNRDLLWVLLSTLVLGIATGGLFLKSISKSQGRVIVFATSLVVLLGAEFVFWKSLREFVLELDAIRESPLIGFLLLLGTLVVLILAVLRNRSSSNHLRRLFSSTLATVGWIYALIGITAVMGSDESGFRELSDTTENRLVLMLLLISLTLILMSSIVVAYTIVQERYRLNEAQRQLRWAAVELAESADAERRLRLAGVQWMGTAGVIARLFKFPLGSNFANIVPATTPIANTSNVLKFEQLPLVLTKRGEQGLSARLRQLFIGKGWLGRQYRQLILRFQDDFAFSRGLQVSEVRAERPEGCSALPTFEDVFEGRARGPRWSFLRSVFAGEYDSALLDTTSEVQLEDAYSNIVVDAEAHSVGSTEQTASEFFAKLIPPNNVQLPKGLVSVLFSGADDRRFMIPYLWWPEELLQRPEGSMDALRYRAAEVLSPSKITEPIRLFGACVLLSHPFKLADINVGAGGIEEFDAELSEPTWGGGDI